MYIITMFPNRLKDDIETKQLPNLHLSWYHYNLEESSQAMKLSVND